MLYRILVSMQLELDKVAQEACSVSWVPSLPPQLFAKKLSNSLVLRGTFYMVWVRATLRCIPQSYFVQRVNYFWKRHQITPGTVSSLWVTC